MPVGGGAEAPPCSFLQIIAAAAASLGWSHRGLFCFVGAGSLSLPTTLCPGFSAIPA